jgi:hypothetical protein
MARAKGPFDAVQFTKESSERIARVVRSAELMPSISSPLTFESRLSDRHPKQVRVARFSGAWPAGTVKTVTFKFAPTATANVTNLSWPITLSGYANEDCLVGREGTNWWLIVPVLEARTAIMVTRTAATTIMQSVTLAATLNTSNCAITVSQTPATSIITVISQAVTSAFIRLRVP